jgi:hypothetical protein
MGVSNQGRSALNYATHIEVIVLCLDTPTSSGLVDLDYPSLADPTIGLSSVNELGNVHRVPLPAELNEQFERILDLLLASLVTEFSSNVEHLRDFYHRKLKVLFLNLKTMRLSRYVRMVTQLH